MLTKSGGGRPGTIPWLLSLCGLVGATLYGVVGPGADVVWAEPVVLFWVVVIGASLCAIGSGYVLAMAGRNDLAETGILGGALMVGSLLPIVHGITVPGVVYGPNDAVMASAYVSWPLALIVMLPLATRRLAPRFASLWRGWVSLWIAFALAAAGWMLAVPDVLTIPARDSALNLAIVAIGFFGGMAAGWSQLRLYWVGRASSNFVASIGFAFLGCTSFVWLGEQPFTLGFWFAHALDIGGVLIACVFVLAGHRVDRAVIDALRPVSSRDPLVALEVGLAPVVHDFVAALERKDPITRDHVVRCAEIAMRVGERLGLRGPDLRSLGLAALLHDIGKLAVPDEILNKPGRLTDDEYAIIKRHTDRGFAMLFPVEALAEAAPLVRWHHERIDGAGYPDGLAGDDIPIASKIIAACDAYDAMAHTRQYRSGLGHDRAIAVLREHSGSQWDPAIVEALVGYLAEERTADDWLVGLAAVGRTDGQIACGCQDALPVDIRDELDSAIAL